MGRKIIRLGNTEEECRQSRERYMKKRLHIREKLEENGWKPIVDDNGLETGLWNNVMINPLLVLPENVVYQRVLDDELLLRENKWNRYSYFSNQCGIFYGWINRNWGIIKPQPAWRALEITKKKTELTATCVRIDYTRGGKN